MTNEMEKVEIEIKRLRKDREFLLNVCKYAMVIELQGQKVIDVLQEAVNQVEIVGVSQ